MQKEVYNKSLFKYADKNSGIHRKDGIFIMKGHKVRQNKFVNDLEIIDIAPKILYDMGLPVQDDMDGRILRYLFKDSFQKANQVKFIKVESKYVADENVLYSPDESDQMKKLLRYLGYFG